MTSLDDKKELVRQAIIRAVPSVMDLKMGCKVTLLEETAEEMKGRERYTAYCIHSNGGGSFFSSELSMGYEPTYILKQDFDYFQIEIIGHPITLQDIMFCFDKNREKIGTVWMAGEHFYTHTFFDVAGKYDLTKDFDHQSESFYLFAYGLFYE